MKRTRWNGPSAVGWAGAAVVLALASLPNSASGRPYLPEYGPWPEGDPTADDQPSPTPKGGRAAALPIEHGSRSLTAGRYDSMARFVWLEYVRTWIRIGIR